VRAAIVAIVLASAGAAHAEVRHVPPADAEAGSALELVAEAPATTPTLVAHVRTTGTTAWAALELVRRDEAHWVAVVPATAVERPGLDYYLDAGGEHVFATPEWPHTLAVHASPEAERRARDVLRSANRRSRVHTMAEWVTYGEPVVSGMRVPDHYYRIDGDFSYKLWAYPLEELSWSWIGDRVALVEIYSPGGRFRLPTEPVKLHREFCGSPFWIIAAQALHRREIKEPVLQQLVRRMRIIGDQPFVVVPDNRGAAQPFKNAHLNFLRLQRNQPVEPGAETLKALTG